MKIFDIYSPLLFLLYLLLLDERICSPPFMVLNTECTPDVLEQIRRQGLAFPFSKFAFLDHFSHIENMCTYCTVHHFVHYDFWRISVIKGFSGRCFTLLITDFQFCFCLVTFLNALFVFPCLYFFLSLQNTGGSWHQLS